jgi:hypothetical protein
MRLLFFCKSEHRGFKKAKERTWDGASLMGQCKSGGKDFKRDCAKKKAKRKHGQCKSKEKGFKKRL